MLQTLRNKPIFTLTQVAASIKTVLSNNFVSSFWVKAEINKLNLYTYSGHCYPELVDKTDNRITAQLKSVLWKDDFDRINVAFINTLKEPLKDGIKVMMLCTVVFDAVYGLSLRIHDIDPTYTLGDLEREKAESIEKLKSEDLFERNKTLLFPLLPKRIAIISVETSKGYSDFMQVMNENEWGYKFFFMLFPAILQGDSAVRDITYQLNRIKKLKSHFDAVTIIRGGGGDVGLSCYNNYNLSKTIASFPLPVLSGIGHSTNETVAELVSYYNAITPTKLAEYLIQKFHNFAVPVQVAESIIRTFSKDLVESSKSSIQNSAKIFKSLGSAYLSNAHHRLERNMHELDNITRNELNEARQILTSKINQLKTLSNRQFQDNRNKIGQNCLILDRSGKVGISNGKKEMDQLEKLIQMADPQNILKRGFSISSVNGKTIYSAEELKPGDILETRYSKGKSISTIQSKHEH